MNLFEFGDSNEKGFTISKQFWIFVVTAVPLTMLTLGSWYIITKRQVRLRQRRKEEREGSKMCWDIFLFCLFFILFYFIFSLCPFASLFMSMYVSLLNIRAWKGWSTYSSESTVLEDIFCKLYRYYRLRRHKMHIEIRFIAGSIAQLFYPRVSFWYLRIVQLLFY